VSTAVDTSADRYQYATGELLNARDAAYRGGDTLHLLQLRGRFVPALTRMSARDSLVGGQEETASSEQRRTSRGSSVTYIADLP